MSWEGSKWLKLLNAKVWIHAKIARADPSLASLAHVRSKESFLPDLSDLNLMVIISRDSTVCICAFAPVFMASAMILIDQRPNTRAIPDDAFSHCAQIRGLRSYNPRAQYILNDKPLAKTCLKYWCIICRASAMVMLSYCCASRHCGSDTSYGIRACISY